MAIEITFLGTSEAIPTATKSQTAILLRYENETILIDCGEGTQRQFRIAKLNPCKLTRILITHWHGDHILGLPGLLQTLALNNYAKTLHVYGPVGTERFMQAILKMFIFQNALNIEIHEIHQSGPFLDTKAFTLTAYKMAHFTPCLAYRFQEHDRRKIKVELLRKLGLRPGPLIGSLQQGKTINFKGELIKPEQVTELKKGKVATFIFDTSPNKNCIAAARAADLLISEATFLEAEHLDKARERGHLTAKQAAQIAKQANVKQLILTHISQRYAKDESVILKEAKELFKNTTLAKDFMTIKL